MGSLPGAISWAWKRVVEYMFKVHKHPSHGLPRMEWEASKKTHKINILYFGWMQNMEKWFGRWDVTPLLHDVSIDCSLNEAFLTPIFLFSPGLHGMENKQKTTKKQNFVFWLDARYRKMVWKVLAASLLHDVS